MDTTGTGDVQGAVSLNIAKKEAKEEILDFLGGEKFLKENMPYIDNLLEKSGQRKMRLSVAPMQPMDVHAYYDESQKRLYIEKHAGLEGENQFVLSEIKVERPGKEPVRFKQVHFGENRIQNCQYLELEPEELEDIAIRTTLMWKNGDEELPQNQMCRLYQQQIPRLTAGVKKIELKAPVKGKALKEKEIVISYGRSDQYKLTCDYEVNNTQSINNVQMIRIPFDLTVYMDKGEVEGLVTDSSSMQLIGNKGNIVRNEKLGNNLCISGTNPFRVYLQENMDWGAGLARSSVLQNDNFKLTANLVFKMKGGDYAMLGIQSADVPQSYAGGFRMDIPMLKLYWGCLGKDTLVEKCNGELCAISMLKAGDRIKTGKTGKEGVVRDILKGYEERLWKLEAEDGRILLMTKEHPVLCKDGWRTIADLADGDELYSVKENSFVRIRYVYPVEYNDDVYNLNIEYLSEDKGFLAEGFLAGDYEMQNNIIRERQEKEGKLRLPDEIKEQIKRFAET